MQQIELNLLFFLKVIKRHIRLFLLIHLFAVIISVIVALVLPVFYEAKVTFYPYSPEASDPRIMLNEQQEFTVFSNEDQSERFILIGKSKRVKDYLINKYNLFEKYNIDSTMGLLSRTKLYEEMQSNIKFKKGEHGAVTVSVFDRNRDTCAMLVNDVVKQIEISFNETIKDKNKKVLEVYDDQYNKMNVYIGSIKDSLKYLQSIKADAKSFVALNNQIEFAMEEFTKLKVKYETAKIISNKDLKSILVIEEATPPYRKAKPTRSVIVLGTLAFTFIGLLSLLSLIEFFKERKFKI